MCMNARACVYVCVCTERERRRNRRTEQLEKKVAKLKRGKKYHCSNVSVLEKKAIKSGH